MSKSKKVATGRFRVYENDGLYTTIKAKNALAAWCKYTRIYIFPPSNIIKEYEDDPIIIHGDREQLITERIQHNLHGYY